MIKNEMQWNCRLAVLALGIAFGAGCLTEGNFDQKLARAGCERTEECAQAEFEAQFDSVGECVDELSEQENPATECLESAGCDFDRAGARDCLQAVRSGTCEDYAEGEWVNDCDDIYDCTAEQEAEFVECISGFDG